MTARPGVTVEPWGRTEHGAVERYTLTNGRVRVRILSYGGVVQSIETPDRDGNLGNVALGFADLAGYLGPHPYFGGIIGRFANRIARGAFTLDGDRYQLPRNDGPNSLHGGTVGFDRHIWSVSVEPAGGAGPGLALTHTSPHGDQGYPGTLRTTVGYTVTADDGLLIDYRADTDAPTVINLTNHTYFNLAGENAGSTEGHELWLNADHYLPVDGSLIPTGVTAPVAGTPMDFTRPTAIGARIRDDFEQLRLGRGFDHCYGLNGGGRGSIIEAARAHDRASGRELTVLTDQPGIQFYSGSLLDGTLVGTGGRAYQRGDALVLETQHFPDSPNQPHFPSTVLQPGEIYRTTTEFRFATR